MTPPPRCCWTSDLQSADVFEEQVAAPGEAVTHTLPDGAMLSVPSLALASVGEALFDPCGMTGTPQAGLTEELLTSVKACLHDQRRQMCVRQAKALLLACVATLGLTRVLLTFRLESVILCGGGRAMAGLDSRLLKELTAAAPAHIRPVRVVAFCVGASLEGLTAPRVRRCRASCSPPNTCRPTRCGAPSSGAASSCVHTC